MKILVTGAAGFIGSNFVQYILEKHPDTEVVVLDLLTYSGNLNNLKGIMDKITFVKGDIRKKEDVEKVIKGCETVVHFAAESHVDRSIVDSQPFLTTNVIGTNVMLEMALKHNIKKFIQISTDEVYGSTHEGSFKETDPLAPNNPYSASKAGAEMLARAFYVTYGLPVVITRSSNNYGPYQHPEKFIPRCITNLARSLKIPIYGTGENIRDWLYVNDNCEAIDLVMREAKAGEVYNIGGECEKTNIEVAKFLLKYMNMPETMIEHITDRKGHDFRYSISTEKFSKLGWTPKTNFEAGLKQTVNWYLKNKQWWMPLLEKQ